MKSYRFLFNSMSPFSRKQVYGSEIGPLAVGAMQDLHNHAITRLAWGLLYVSYTPRA